MWMGAITVGHNSEPEFAIPITQQESSVTRHAAAVRDVTVTVAHLSPPGQTEAGGLIAPNIFNRAVELIILAREHLIQSCLANQTLVFEDAAIEICNQPIRLIEHCAIDNSRGPHRSLEPHSTALTSALLIK